MIETDNRCPHCGRLFGSPDSYLQHCRNKHGGKTVQRPRRRTREPKTLTKNQTTRNASKVSSPNMLALRRSGGLSGGRVRPPLIRPEQ